MGRPLNKRVFKAGAGNQLKVRAKIGASAEGNGTIISQKSAHRYRVSVGNDMAVCNLVTKADGLLLENEMSIEVITDGSVAKKVSKLTSKHAFVDGVKHKWSFDASTTDGAVQASDAETPVIAVTSQPVSVTSLTNATFTVSASVNAGYTLKYRWAVSSDDGVTWANTPTNGVYSGSSSATLTISSVTELNAKQYRCAVSSTKLETVYSDAATLTVA